MVYWLSAHLGRCFQAVFGKSAPQRAFRQEARALFHVCTQVHQEPKRPRISTYLGESFQLICWIFSEVFWLSEYRILARLTKKWPAGESDSSTVATGSARDGRGRRSAVLRGPWRPGGSYSARRLVPGTSERTGAGACAPAMRAVTKLDGY